MEGIAMLRRVTERRRAISAQPPRATAVFRTGYCFSTEKRFCSSSFFVRKNQHASGGPFCLPADRPFLWAFLCVKFRPERLSRGGKDDCECATRFPDFCRGLSVLAHGRAEISRSLQMGLIPRLRQHHFGMAWFSLPEYLCCGLSDRTEVFPQRHRPQVVARGHAGESESHSCAPSQLGRGALLKCRVISAPIWMASARSEERLARSPKNRVEPRPIAAQGKEMKPGLCRGYQKCRRLAQGKFLRKKLARFSTTAIGSTTCVSPKRKPSLISASSVSLQPAILLASATTGTRVGWNRKQQTLHGRDWSRRGESKSHSAGLPECTR